MLIQTRVTVRKRLSWVLTSVTLTFDLWPWPFAWTSLLSSVITPENFMMLWWWEYGEKGVTDGQTNRQTNGQTDKRTDGLNQSYSCLVQLKILTSCLEKPDMHCPACVIMMVSYALVSNRCQGISNNHGNSTVIMVSYELDESTARPQLKSPRSLSGRSLYLTLVTKWSRSHMTLKIQISRSWPRSNPLSNLRPRVQINMFAFRLTAIGPLLVEI